MTRHTFRYKRHGLGSFGWKLLVALWWGAAALTLDSYDLPDTWWTVALVFAGLFGPPIALFMWSERLAAHQKQRDVDAALQTIKRPLRNESLPDGQTVSFDPHYPTPSTTGGMVYAIDPRRRFLRMISSNLVDANGRNFEEVGPLAGRITGVRLEEQPGPRRWLWLLPPRKEDDTLRLTVTVRADEGQQNAMAFVFRTGDPAAEGWRRAFEQWMAEDEAARAPEPQALPALKAEPSA